MGTYNYLIIPEWKIKISTKSNFLDDYECDRWKELISFLEEEKTINEERNINEFGVINKLMKNYEIIKGLYPIMYFEDLLQVYLRLKGIEFFVYSEYDEENLKPFKDCKVIN